LIYLKLGILTANARCIVDTKFGQNRMFLLESRKSTITYVTPY